MKPTIDNVITSLSRLIDSPYANAIEVSIATKAAANIAFLEDFLNLPLSADYPAWYYASLLVSNLLKLPVQLRVYTVMIDDISELRVSEEGVLIADPTMTDIGPTVSILTYSEGRVPWAYDWIITKPTANNPDYHVQVNAVYRKCHTSSTETLH